MSDPLTLLENKLDDKYRAEAAAIATSSRVVDWSDYMHRAGYLQAIRDIGQMIKDVRNPEKPEETGEIPSILEV